MKDRLITLVLALGALVLFYALFFPKPAPEDDSTVLPVSTETKADGYQALWRWLQDQHIPVASVRERYDRLTKYGSTSTGNVLLATLPQQLPARPDEMEQLDEWIERGNTLVVMAALDDTPEWALRADATFIDVLGRMTRLKFSTGGASSSSSESATEEQESDVGDDQDADAASDDTQESSSNSSGTANSKQSFKEAFEKLLNPERSSIEQNGSHPLLAGVQSVATLSEFPASRWRAGSMDAAAILVIGKRAADDSDKTSETGTDAVLWLKRQSKGQIIVCAFATPFTNRLIGAADNARLFANILAWSRSPAGAVLFDDAHQGLVSYYDAKAFFADPRLHRTLLWILLLWLLFVLGWQRFRPQVDHWNPVDVTTFIKVTGGFFAGSLSAAATGQRLFENFFNRLRRRLALPEDGQPVWEWLAEQASITNHELHDLQRLYAVTQRGKRVDLMQLQNRLTSLMRHLA